jgi:hypothetical protein
MKPSRSVRSLDREVRTWTESNSDKALINVVVALLRRIHKIDRTYDIPYIAGYSRDGSTVFIDRHMPRSFAYRGRRGPPGRSANKLHSPREISRPRRVQTVAAGSAP